MFIKRLLQTALLLTSLLTQLSFAQSPQLDLLIDGNLIIGIVNTADGAPATDAAVTVENLSRSNDISTLSSDVAGIFTVTGDFETEYRLTVEIDGQSVSGSVRTGEAPPVPFQWPPIYITLGLLGLLSLFPAHYLRRKDLPS